MDETRRQTIEYKFLRQNTHHAIPRMRFAFSVYLAIFHISFVILYGFFCNYSTTIDSSNGANTAATKSLYSSMAHLLILVQNQCWLWINLYICFNVNIAFMDVNSMIFIGFGFLVTFLKRYGYGGVGFNFLIAAYSIEWALLVRGWLDSGLQGSATFSISLNRFAPSF